MADNTHSVADELRALAAKRRMTHSEIAKRAGRSVSWVSRRLSGETPCTVDGDLRLFAKVFDVDPRSLIPAGQP